MPTKHIPVFTITSGLFMCGIRWHVEMDGVGVAHNLKTEEDAKFEANKIRRIYIAGQANIPLDRLYETSDGRFIDLQTDEVIG